MARPGVSYENVEAVIVELMAKGENPTNTAIRQQLGDTGSFSTINRLRQEIMEKRSVTPVVSVSELPDSVSEAGRRLLRTVWEEASAQAAAAREVERKAFEEQKSAFASQQAEMLGEIERLERTLEVSESAAEQHAAETVAMREARSEVQREVAAAEASLVEVRREAENLRSDCWRLEKELRDEGTAWQAERGELEKTHSGLEVEVERLTTALQDVHIATEKAEKEASHNFTALGSLREEMGVLLASVAASNARAESLAEQNAVMREDQQKSMATLTEWVERATKAEAMLAGAVQKPEMEVPTAEETPRPTRQRKTEPAKQPKAAPAPRRKRTAQPKTAT